MQRRKTVTIVAFLYTAYCTLIMGRSLLVGLVRPSRVQFGPWILCAALGLLCYGLTTRRPWARPLGLFVGIFSLFLLGIALLWGYAFSGFSSRSGQPEFSIRLLAGLLPALLCSLTLLALLIKPLPEEDRDS
jgi:hypothetical protein